MSLRLVFGCALLMSLAACAGGKEPLVSSPHVTVVHQDALPAPSGEDMNVGSSGFQIGPFDKLSIAVLGMEELNMKIVTDGAGKFTFPLAGVIDANGRTVEEVTRDIVSKMRENHVRDPQVSVNLEESNSHNYTIDGDVGQPGNYPVMGRMTLMQAVAGARGTTEFAKLSEVVVFRTVNGQRMAALYNLGAIRRGLYADPRIYPNDIVVVGDSPARRLFRDIVQAAPLLTTPLVVLLQNN